jgi:hypothetical protein
VDTAFNVISTTNLTDIVYPEVQQKTLETSIYHRCAKIYMKVDGEEYIIHNPTGTYYGYNIEKMGVIQMKKVNNQWVLDKIYKDIKFGNARNYQMLDERTFVVSDAQENSQGGVGGYNYIGKMSGGNITWTKINSEVRWTHDISGGDLNGDGLIDVVCASPLSIYIQNNDNTFTKRDDLYKWEQRISPFAVEVRDLFGDKTPEIIAGGYYGSGDPSQKNNIAVYSFNKETNQFEIVFDNKNPNAFYIDDMGATSIEVSDFNNDGKMDIAVAREKDNKRSIDIWKGDGNGNFIPSDYFIYTLDKIEFSEFKVLDVNNDGFMDIVLNGNGNGSIFRIGNPWEKVLINNLIHINNGNGTFHTYDAKNITVDGIPDYLYPYKKGNDLCFYGTHTENSITGGIKVKYFDVTIKNL